MFDWLRRRTAAPVVPDALWQDVLGQFPFLADRSEADVARRR